MEQATSEHRNSLIFIQDAHFDVSHLQRAGKANPRHWYPVNVVLWHQVHCGLSSIKGKIDKMGPFISIRVTGFHGCHGGLYQRKVLEDWHLKLFSSSIHSRSTFITHFLCNATTFVYAWPL